MCGFKILNMSLKVIFTWWNRQTLGTFLKTLFTVSIFESSTSMMKPPVSEKSNFSIDNVPGIVTEHPMLYSKVISDNATAIQPSEIS